MNEPTKKCPVCGTMNFDDMNTCYSCLHDFCGQTERSEAMEREVHADYGNWYDCPCCGSSNTDGLGQESWRDGYAELNKCYDCGCRFEVVFAYMKTVVTREGGE